MSRIRISAIFIVIILCFSMPDCAFPGEIFSDNFDGYSDTPLNHGWTTMGSNVSATADGGYLSSRGIVVNYDHQGYADFVLNKFVEAYALSELYVFFRAKVNNVSGGSKFFKYFGVDASSAINYANTTFMIGYYSGTLYEISYGCGDGIQNDTQCVIPYNGSTPTDTNVSVDTYSSNFDPRDNAWHTYQFYMKYNTDDNRDGVYKIWIDGVLRLHATNVKNRHNDNVREFERVEFGGYTHSNWSEQWYLYYDDIVISDSYISSTPTASGLVSSGVTFGVSP